MATSGPLNGKKFWRSLVQQYATTASASPRLLRELASRPLESFTVEELRKLLEMEVHPQGALDRILDSWEKWSKKLWLPAVLGTTAAVTLPAFHYLAGWPSSPPPPPDWRDVGSRILSRSLLVGPYVLAAGLLSYVLWNRSVLQRRQHLNDLFQRMLSSRGS